MKLNVGLAQHWTSEDEVMLRFDSHGVRCCHVLIGFAATMVIWRESRTQHTRISCHRAQLMQALHTYTYRQSLESVRAEGVGGQKGRHLPARSSANKRTHVDQSAPPVQHRAST